MATAQCLICNEIEGKLFHEDDSIGFVFCGKECQTYFRNLIGGKGDVWPPKPPNKRYRDYQPKVPIIRLKRPSPPDDQGSVDPFEYPRILPKGFRHPKEIQELRDLVSKMDLKLFLSFLILNFTEAQPTTNTKEIMERIIRTYFAVHGTRYFLVHFYNILDSHVKEYGWMDPKYPTAQNWKELLSNTNFYFNAPTNAIMGAAAHCFRVGYEAKIFEVSDNQPFIPVFLAWCGQATGLISISETSAMEIPTYQKVTQSACCSDVQQTLYIVKHFNGSYMKDPEQLQAMAQICVTFGSSHTLKYLIETFDMTHPLIVAQISDTLNRLEAMKGEITQRHAHTLMLLNNSKLLLQKDIYTASKLSKRASK